MEDVPPSYQSAVNRDAWNIIAPWVRSSDLFSACLVSRKWHTTFAPFLWGDPASHFGTENEAVYVALTRFKRRLRGARLIVRQLSHTLRLPSASSEIYGGPDAFWLRDVLENLPNLQSLIVSQLPFFDHHSLTALRHVSISRRSSLEEESERSHYDLKLLLAEREFNTTTAGLTEGLLHFPHLIYLDLSYTSPARDASFLSALANLCDLQVLKLRGVGLRDGGAEVLTNTIGLRVRLLDLRENHLTDVAVRFLMQSCFLPPDDLSTSRDVSTRQTEYWPVALAPGPGFLSLDSLRSEELDQQLLRQLTHPLTGRLAVEDIPHKGLTHLYIANNNLSIKGLSSLLRSTRLHVLDAGTVERVKTIPQTRPLSSLPSHQDEVRSSGAESLLPVLATNARHNLTYLRVSHEVATESMPEEEHKFSTAAAREFQWQERGLAEASTPARHSIELPSQNIFELSAEPVFPESEFPKDRIHSAWSSPFNTAPDQGVSVIDIEAIRSKTGNETSASEVFASDTTRRVKEGDDEIAPNDLPKDSARSTDQYDSATTESRTVSHPRHARPWSSASHLALIEMLLRKRPLNPFTAKSGGTLPGRHSRQVYTYLHPSYLPNLRTLVLTGVPTHLPKSSPTIAALLRFVSACAHEAYLALLQAKADYSLPPGHSRHVAEAQHARSLFALETLVLEMATIGPSNASTGKAWDHSHAKLNMLKSSTGDRDSEALWSAAESDFSFFREEGEAEDECRTYLNRPEESFLTATMDESIISGPSVSPFDSSAPTSSSMLRPTMLSPKSLQRPEDLLLGSTRRPGSSAAKTNKDVVTSASRTGTMLPAEMFETIPTPSSAHPPSPPKEERLVDVVSELAKFREERKKAYEDALLKRSQISPNNRLNHTGLGHADGTGNDIEIPFVEGYWKGKIRIVRNAAPNEKIVR